MAEFLMILMLFCGFASTAGGILLLILGEFKDGIMANIMGMVMFLGAASIMSIENSERIECKLGALLENRPAVECMEDEQ